MQPLHGRCIEYSLGTLLCTCTHTLAAGVHVPTLDPLSFFSHRHGERAAVCNESRNGAEKGQVCRYLHVLCTQVPHVLCRYHRPYTPSYASRLSDKLAIGGFHFVLLVFFLAFQVLQCGPMLALRRRFSRCFHGMFQHLMHSIILLWGRQSEWVLRPSTADDWVHRTANSILFF